MANIEVWIEELANYGTIESQEEASPQEVLEVHTRYIELVRKYGFDLTNERIFNPRTEKVEEIIYIETIPETIGGTGNEPFMEFHLRSKDIHVPQDDLTFPNKPLTIPNDSEIIFSVKLRENGVFLPYRRATFYIKPDRIRWGVAEKGLGINSTITRSSDCKTLLRLADYYERMRSQARLPNE